MNIKKTLMKLLVIALIVALATASSSSSSSSRMPWILNSHTSTASSEPRARGPRFELKAEGSIGNPGIAIVSTRAIPDSVFVLTRGPSAHVVQVNQEDLTETASKNHSTAGSCLFLLQIFMMPCYLTRDIIEGLKVKHVKWGRGD